NFSSETIDLVIADPPYLVNYRPRNGANYYANDDSSGWLKPAFAEIYRVLKRNRFCIYFFGWPRAEHFLTAWKEAGFYPVGHLIWLKRYRSKALFLKASHESAYLLAKGRPMMPKNPMRDELDSPLDRFNCLASP